MEPTKELVDALYADKVRAARQTPIEERFLAGPRRFNIACQLMRAGGGGPEVCDPSWDARR
ncbi:MAG: hypothetical protein EDS66_02720 [Planctomycetota bacterium]|nr:MAG: hypothetical protein EDS66_02720 [Planctomycetota bacterium]MCQ3920474.1 hypothetical protein [Planctomycetota bacterium]